MKEFILLRGHQGSGKSYFADEKINEFKQNNPNGIVIHINNDNLLTDSNGHYNWTREGLKQAQKINHQRFINALNDSYSQPVLIINSNMNVKVQKCQQMIGEAKKCGFNTTIYRLSNGFDNVHGVKHGVVQDIYINILNNPVPNQIDIPPIKDFKIKHNRIKNIDYDNDRKTFVNKDYLNQNKQNYIQKKSQKYPELSVYKYRNTIFFQNRFDDALLEMRGLVMDKDHNIIIRPFRKVFNYSERTAVNANYPLHIDDCEKVTAVVKVNGFMGVCTYVDRDTNGSFNKQVLYSTTGSLDSVYAQMVEYHCDKYNDIFKQYPNHSFIFEINDESDPHVIKEEVGETFIGLIDVINDIQYPEYILDEIANKNGLKRPQTIHDITFGELKTMLKNVQHEGFMVFDENNNMLAKLKSPFYLMSKLFGRGKDELLQKRLDKSKIDEEYYPLVDYLQQNWDSFKQLDEYQKMQVVQDFFIQELMGGRIEIKKENKLLKP